MSTHVKTLIVICFVLGCGEDGSKGSVVMLGAAGTGGVSVGGASGQSGMAGIGGGDSLGGAGGAEAIGGAGGAEAMGGAGGLGGAGGAEAMGGADGLGGAGGLGGVGGGMAMPAVEIPDAPVATGVCPEFTTGTNTITPSGNQRQIDVYLPADPNGAPVLFIWHGLGDSAGNMGRFFRASTIANEFNSIVIVPHSSGQFAQSEWAFFGGDPQTDARVFDESLACLNAQYGIDMNRIYTTGFSAGSLWSTWLLMNRSQYLAAVTLFSGGAGLINPYATPAHDVPLLAFYGGASDVFGGGVINFSELTNGLATNLTSDGHFVVLCNHDGGHRIPLDPMIYAMPFLFAHTHTMVESPYSNGLGPEWAPYCAIQ